MTIAHHGAWVLVVFRYCQPTKFDSIKQFVCFGYDQAFLEEVKVDVISNHNNEGATYAFLDKLFNRFGALTPKVPANQGMKFHEEF